MFPDYLSESQLHRIIEQALLEDLGSGDVTTLSTIPKTTRAEAFFISKDTGIVAGLYVGEYAFRQLDTSLDIDWKVEDGDRVVPGTVIGSVKGLAHPILSAERVALNFMQRMGGIASATDRMVQAAKPHKAQILDTRKTVPGLRPLDKWAVETGGGMNHRIGLYDMILIKDNHIASAGGIAPAIRAANEFRASHPTPLRIEIETTTLDEVNEVLETGDVDIIMLDNMTHYDESGRFDTSLLQQAVNLIAGRFETEASGNVTEETVPVIAATGVDRISSGALTHSVKALDISLKIGLQFQD